MKECRYFQIQWLLKSISNKVINKSETQIEKNEVWKISISKIGHATKLETARKLSICYLTPLKNLRLARLMTRSATTLQGIAVMP